MMKPEINSSKSKGITIDWKIFGADPQESDLVKLPEPYQQVELKLEHDTYYTLRIYFKQSLPAELKLTLTVINDDTQASLVLPENLLDTEDDRKTAGSYQYLQNIGDWSTKHGFIHYRIVINNHSVVEFKDAMVANLGEAFGKKWANDVRLLVGGQVIEANKFILMAHSDVFRTMFNEVWDGNEVEIKFVEYEHMLAFIKSLYSGSIELKGVEHAFSIMTLAERYNVAAIKSACGDYIGKNLTVSNVLTSFIGADKLGATLLVIECIRFMSTLHRVRLNKLTETEEWKQLNKCSACSAFFKFVLDFGS